MGPILFKFVFVDEFGRDTGKFASFFNGSVEDVSFPKRKLRHLYLRKIVPV